MWGEGGLKLMLISRVIKSFFFTLIRVIGSFFIALFGALFSFIVCGMMLAFPYFIEMKNWTALTISLIFWIIIISVIQAELKS